MISLMSVSGAITVICTLEFLLTTVDDDIIDNGTDYMIVIKLCDCLTVNKLYERM